MVKKKPARKAAVARLRTIIRPNYNEIAANTRDADVPTTSGYTNSGMKGKKRRKRRKGKKADKSKAASLDSAPDAGEVEVVAHPRPKAKAKAKSQGAKRKKADEHVDTPPAKRLTAKTKPADVLGTAGLRAKDVSASVIAHTSPDDFINSKERVADGNKVYSDAFRKAERKIKSSGKVPSLSVVNAQCAQAGRIAKAKWMKLSP